LGRRPPPEELRRTGETIQRMRTMKTTMTTKATIRPCSVMARIRASLHLLSALLCSLWVFGAAGVLSGDNESPVDLLSPISLPTIFFLFLFFFLLLLSSRFLMNGRKTERKV